MPHRLSRIAQRALPTLSLLSLLVASGVGGAAEPESITRWRRDPVRVRETPEGPAMQRKVGDLPAQAPVLFTTRDGLLAFKDLSGQQLFVSKGDVETSAPQRAGDVCPGAPSDQFSMRGSLAQRAPAQATTGQGYGGGRRC